MCGPGPGRRVIASSSSGVMARPGRRRRRLVAARTGPERSDRAVGLGRLVRRDGFASGTCLDLGLRLAGLRLRFADAAPQRLAQLGQGLGAAPQEHEHEDDDQDDGEILHPGMVLARLRGACRRPGTGRVSWPAMLLVFGPRSTDFDFGPGHPLTPRRFGPGIDLLRAVGAEPGLAPEPAADEELLWGHTQRYLDVVKRFSVDPYGFPEAGIGEGGDCPPFAGMHEASAAVAGGSLRAVDAVLRGDVDHAYHPGGGLHHAMPDRASGFCIYDDPALAIVRARKDGLRVLYIDLDVHHGDGVQAIHWDDPGVLTVSFHETGRALFPGTGDVDEVGEGVAAGTSVHVPLPT